MGPMFCRLGFIFFVLQNIEFSYSSQAPKIIITTIEHDKEPNNCTLTGRNYLIFPKIAKITLRCEADYPTRWASTANVSRYELPIRISRNENPMPWDWEIPGNLTYVSYLTVNINGIPPNFTYISCMDVAGNISSDLEIFGSESYQDNTKNNSGCINNETVHQQNLPLNRTDAYVSNVGYIVQEESLGMFCPGVNISRVSIRSKPPQNFFSISLERLYEEKQSLMNGGSQPCKGANVTLLDKTTLYPPVCTKSNCTNPFHCEIVKNTETRVICPTKPGKCFENVQSILTCNDISETFYHFKKINRPDNSAHCRERIRAEQLLRIQKNIKGKGDFRYTCLGAPFMLGRQLIFSIKYLNGSEKFFSNFSENDNSTDLVDGLLRRTFDFKNESEPEAEEIICNAPRFDSKLWLNVSERIWQEDTTTTTTTATTTAITEASTKFVKSTSNSPRTTSTLAISESATNETTTEEDNSINSTNSTTSSSTDNSQTDSTPGESSSSTDQISTSKETTTTTTATTKTKAPTIIVNTTSDAPTSTSSLAIIEHGENKPTDKENNSEIDISTAKTEEIVESSMTGNVIRAEEQKSDSNNSQIIIIAVVVVLMIGVIVALSVYYGRRVRKSQNLFRQLTNFEMREFMSGVSRMSMHRFSTFDNVSPMMVPFRQSIEESDLTIELGKIIEQDGFISSYPGSLNGRFAVVRTTDLTTTISFFLKFLKDIKMMQRVGQQPNIVELLGAVTLNIKDRVISVAFESSTLGNVKEYLKRNCSKREKSLSPIPENVEVPDANDDLAGRISEIPIISQSLLNWCEQIATGMNFLQGQHLVHGDLCTRNIFLFPNNVIKISEVSPFRQDFYREHYLQIAKPPPKWRWMAIELLRSKKFTITSDVWAFGVTMWEILSLGEDPYPGIKWSPEFVLKLENGYRMEMPSIANNDVYQILLRCWYRYPNDRPNFGEIQGFIQECRNKTVTITSDEYPREVEIK